jgi:hypothetical protein
LTFFPFLVQASLILLRANKENAFMAMGSFLKNLVSPPSPTPVAPPPVVSPNNPQTAAELAQKQEAAAAAQRKIGGAASDMFTGGTGLGQAPKTSSITLLGS